MCEWMSPNPPYWVTRMIYDNTCGNILQVVTSVDDIVGPFIGTCRFVVSFQGKVSNFWDTIPTTEKAQNSHSTQSGCQERGRKNLLLKLTYCLRIGFSQLCLRALHFFSFVGKVFKLQSAILLNYSESASRGLWTWFFQLPVADPG